MGELFTEAEQEIFETAHRLILSKRPLTAAELDALRAALPLSEREGIDHLSYKIHAALGATEEVARYAKRLMERRNLYDAFHAFEALGDRAGMFRAANAEEDDYLGTGMWGEYLGKERVLAYHQDFDRWVKELGYRNVRISAVQALRMHAVADRYDHGVGIATGGLGLTYIMARMGLPVSIVDAHRYGKGATFSWNGEEPDLRGKRVAVLETDVVSGRTSRRVLRELRRLRPESIDLVLEKNPAEVGGCSGTLTGNIPPEYDRVLHPKEFSYGRLDEAIARMDAATGFSR